ncbi:MAG: hypothetical protein JW959_14805 [Pirellulales bacterium]|nr:hypothetical protein [Pirellulales bacterium]
MSEQSPDDRLCELQVLADASLAGELTDQQTARLERLVSEDRDFRKLYVRYMFVSWNLRSWAKFPLPGADDEDVQTSAEGADFQPSPLIRVSPSVEGPSFSIQSLFGAAVFSYAVSALVVSLAILGAWAYKISHVQPALTKTARSTEENVLPEPVFVGRITGMKDCRWSDPNTRTLIGASVPLEREYALSSGLMEISYAGGAKVILEGPCTYKIESSAGGFLALGKLTANISGQRSAVSGQQAKPFPLSPLPSPLFSVRTPTAIITDLGTEFGVEVGTDGNTFSHVYQGTVKVELPGQPDGGVVLRERESVQVSGATKRLMKVDQSQADAGKFYRRMPARERIKMFNTGHGLAEGDADPHWQVVAASNDPDFKPRPAVVSIANRPSQFRPNDPARAQWISTVPDLSDVPNNATYTFRTTFELTDLLPGSAKLRVGFLADNSVRAMRLNGREITVPEHGHLGPFFDPVRFVVDKGFVEGSNVLEIDVFNGAPESGSSVASPMALLVELEGTMLRGGRESVVKISDEERRANDGKEDKR